MTRMPLNFPAIAIGVGPTASWWEEINESVKWQDGMFFLLCAAYAVVSVIALDDFVAYASKSLVEAENLTKYKLEGGGVLLC
ncbi:E3 ubiquitin-protein ligase tom1 [Orobanche gracilis]